MKELNYSDGFPIRRGDRVYCKKCLLKVIGLSDKEIALQERYWGIYKHAKPDELIFIKPCPWYLPWQK